MVRIPADKGTAIVCEMSPKESHIGIYRKKSHTLKYSTYNSNSPRNNLLGVLKNMLFRAYNVCDPGPEREKEIQTLTYAIVNQDYPPIDSKNSFNNSQTSGKTGC